VVVEPLVLTKSIDFTTDVNSGRQQNLTNLQSCHRWTDCSDIWHTSLYPRGEPPWQDLWKFL